MTIQQFLTDELKILSLEFPMVTFKYGIDKVLLEHIVEISPSKEFVENKALDHRWMKVSDRFSEMFPGEDLVFTSPDSPLKIENPLIHIHKGYELQNYHSIFATIVSKIANQSIDKEWMALMKAVISREVEKHLNISSFEMIKEGATSAKVEISKIKNPISNLQIPVTCLHLGVEKVMESEQIGNSAYAMAA